MRPVTTRSLSLLLILGCMSMLAPTSQAGRRRGPAPKPAVPDFTKEDGKAFMKGKTTAAYHDWNLGPTGAHGWMYGWQGHTAESRQILITEVAGGSPAAEVLQAGDVILGVSGKPFSDDARIGFAKAVAAAEEQSGVLQLTRWREAGSEQVEVKLPVLGRYSETAPYDCPKSKKIFDKGCEAIAARGLDRVTIPNNLNALALLASKDSSYLPMLSNYAKLVVDYRVDGFKSWHYGHATIFLAEYVALTKDKTVMEGLERLAGDIARGQSAVGTWGHTFARPDGNCNGYGCMNSPGIVLAIAMVISREAGVKDPVVDKAIEKSAGFLRWYVDKGAIPYGDHGPWAGHEDNGKCSGAAVLFDLLGDREAAEFFGKMSTAAYDERERGHTGNFFNMVWALPGVAICGPLATGAYWGEHGWYYDLARGWDGSFGYQGSPIGEEEHNKYTEWDSTGAYLLSYALPLKSLYLTGRKPSSVPAMESAEVKDVIAAGRDYFSSSRGKEGYVGRTAEELGEGLASWSPAVRKRSARALAETEGDFVPALLKMLEGTDRYASYGAVEALGYLGQRADAAGPRLRELLKSSDPWLQILACEALPRLGPEERDASVPALLAMMGRNNPNDPRDMAKRSASAALFSPYPGHGGYRALLADSLEGVDRDLLYPAIETALNNQDGAGRGTLTRIYGQLNDRDLVALLPAITKAVEEMAPSNEMFASAIRVAGLDVLSRLKIEEGMPLCVSVISADQWGMGKRLEKCLEYLARYGAQAKSVLPELQKEREIIAGRRGAQARKDLEAIDRVVETIKTSKEMPTVISMEEFAAE